jgi:hypothetical protein
MSALSAKIAQLSPRERLLLGVMVAWLSIGATLVVIWVAVGSMRELSQGNDDRRAAMLELLAQRTTFAQQQAASQELAERLSNNELRLSSFIESAATRAGLPAPTDFNDRQTPREGGITAFETTARFQGIELADFDRLMNELRSSEELVYIQHVSLEPGRGRSASQLVAEVTLVTYRRQAGGSRD